MHVGWSLIKGISLPQRDRGFARDLHGEFSLQNIHEDLGVMPVRQGSAAGQILHRQHDEFLAVGTHEVLVDQLLDDRGRRSGVRAGVGSERAKRPQSETGRHRCPLRMVVIHG